LKETDFTGTMFERQVAHGYFIMSAAAGLFVDSYEKNPVLLNYGIDELRFTKPVYPGTEVHIKFTCKEKLPQDQKPVRMTEGVQSGRDDSEISRGIVRWVVEIIDEKNEQVGIATILTMVKRKN
jgi:oxepin-CoA hydrolase/3-oxo-5,6-dehydrosuberyl-CoA semialdehyde dehydrogenase